jgi:hypothetical protein
MQKSCNCVIGRLCYVSVSHDETPAQNTSAEAPCVDQVQRRVPIWDFKATHYVTAALTIALLVVAALQLGTYRQQTDILDAQAKISAGQLFLNQAVQRPWLDITSISPVSPISLQWPSYFSIRLDINNTGQLPATNIWVEGEIHSYQPKDTIEDIVENGKKFCLNLKKNRSGPIVAEGRTIMPGGTTPRTIGILVSSADIVKFNTPSIVNGLRVTNQLNAFGCLDYVSPGDRIHHQTPFEFEIDKLGPNGGFLALDPNQTAPPQSLNLGEHPSLLWAAD